MERPVVKGVTSAPDTPARCAGCAQALAASPNPFNPQVMISFRLGSASRVDLAIYDLRGRQVRRVPLGRLEAGPNNFR